MWPAAGRVSDRPVGAEGAGGRPDHGAGGQGVLALNDLNEELDYALIETVEREAICELIQTAAVDCGLQDVPDDVTEDWRAW